MPYTGPAEPFAFTSGPKSARIVAVGEAHGETEALTGLPLMGASGQEFNRMLKEVGLVRSEIFCTNVFALRPEANNIESLCTDRLGLTDTLRLLPPGDPRISPKHPLSRPFRQGKYFSPTYWPEVERLYEEIRVVGPNLIIALGNTACWALLGSTRIGAIRGAITQAVQGPIGTKLLPTYHPAAILRAWHNRPIVIADLQKAAREQHHPEIRRPDREILVSPSLAELVAWFQRPAQLYSVDIETKSRSIEMVSFARSPRDAVVIPFIDYSRPGWSYWPDLEHELRAWHIVRAALESPIPKVFQNGLYDIQYFARMGIFPRACTHDTMLLHHSHYPEMLKGLGFLGSIYTNEPAWKLMRKDESLKRDE